MINKKGFTTKDFIIAGLLFTAVISFFVIGIADVQTNYPDNPNIISASFSANYDKLTNQTSSINTMRETALSGEGLSFRGAFDVTFGSFFTVMQLVFSTLTLFGTMYLNLTTDFPMIDSMVLNNFMIIGLAIITVILIFRLINAVGRNPV
ncbi:hypothetical protein LCGC14_1111930 [marine sediment metagenome]|uniref:Uncharacterized protein n=1 Tax=marine sediment metagenome TaxID=412755 RepID=A0A0F9MUD7_9ZZZZ